MRESQYQAGLIKELKDRFRGCIVLKNDPEYLQGIPDLLVLIGPMWFALEVKASRAAPLQPNQEWWIEEMAGLSHAWFIYPENEEEVLNAIQSALESRRATRVFVR